MNTRHMPETDEEQNDEETQVISAPASGVDGGYGGE